MCTLYSSLPQIPRVFSFHYIIISDILKEVRNALAWSQKTHVHTSSQPCRRCGYMSTLICVCSFQPASRIKDKLSASSDSLPTSQLRAHLGRILRIFSSQHYLQQLGHGGNLRSPSADKWIKKLQCIYTMEYYSAIKKNSFESVLMRWMKLEPSTVF